MIARVSHSPEEAVAYRPEKAVAARRRRPEKAVAYRRSRVPNVKYCRPDVASLRFTTGAFQAHFLAHLPAGFIANPPAAGEVAGSWRVPASWRLRRVGGFTETHPLGGMWVPQRTLRPPRVMHSGVGDGGDSVMVGIR